MLVYLLSLLFLMPPTAAPQHHRKIFSGGGSTPAIVQTCGNQNFGTSVTCTITPHSTSNLLVVIGWLSSTTALTGTTGTCSSSWTTPTGGSTTTSNSRQWQTATPSGTSSCTVIVNQGGGNAAMMLGVYEISNVVATLDGTPGFAFGFHSAAFNGPSTTTTVANDIVLAAGFVNATTALNVTSATAYYPADLEALEGGAVYISLSHLVLATPGATNANYTPAASTNFATTILALQP